jgi:tetratricopeptide (TPR) repeat protein
MVKAGKHGTTEKHKTANQNQMEASLYFMGAAYAKLEADPQRTAAYRKAALTMLNSLITSYKESKFAPAALNLMATLYTLDNKPDETRRTLNELKRKYPDTPEAKNATFSLAMTLLKLGKRRQAARVFKEMFTDQSGNFSDGQILVAGQELFKAKEYEIAMEAFQRLVTAEKRNVQEPAMLGLAQSQIEAKKYADGVKGLRKMMAKYPKSAYRVDIGMYMNRGCNALAPALGDALSRKKQFNEGVLALKKARGAVRTVAQRAMLDLAVARTETAKAVAETKHGNAEGAKDYKGSAVASYQVMLLSAYTADPLARPYVEDAYADCIPLMIEIEFYQDAIEQCDTYLRKFREGTYAVEVAGWKRRARARMAAAGIKVETPTSRPAPAATNAAPAAAGTP